MASPGPRPRPSALDRALAEHGTKVDHAVEIEVPSEELVAADVRALDLRGQRSRLQRGDPSATGRRRSATWTVRRLIQREDDRAETVRARLEQQLGALREVSRHYRDQGVLRTVDGQRSIDDVTADILAIARPTVRGNV